MRIAKFLIVALSLALANSCAGSLQNRAIERASLSIDEGKGRVIFSTRAGEACLAGTELQITRVGAFMAGVTVFANAVQIRSDFPDHIGYLNVIELREGDYVLSSSGGGTVTGHFHVNAGETVYLGEIDIARGCSGSSPVRVNDERSRDFALIRARNPELADQPVEVRLLEFRSR